MNENARIRDTLERLARSPMEVRADGGSLRPIPEAGRFTLQSLDVLLGRSYEIGEERGYRLASDEYASRSESLRKNLVHTVTAEFLLWLGPLLAEIEGALMEPVVSPSEREERPDDEFVDDRAERLQAALRDLRDTLTGLARDHDLESLAPEQRTTGQVELWREVHPVEAVEELEKLPVGGLTNFQLAAVLANDTHAFAMADRVLVPEAIEELRRRAKMDPDPGELRDERFRHPDGARNVLDTLGVPLEPEPSA